MKAKIVLFVVIFLLWLLLNFVVDRQHCIAGVIVAFLVTLFTGNLFERKFSILRNPSRYGYFLFGYVPLLAWESVKGCFAAAFYTLHPHLPDDSGIVEVKTTLKSELALTLLTNAVSLSPRALSVDVNKEKGVILVHWLYAKRKGASGAAESAVRSFEKILSKIFN